MAKKILKIALAVLMMVVAFFSWRSVDRAINVPSSSDWIVPLVWFTFFFALAYLSSVLIKRPHIVALLIAFALGSSFLFAQNIAHLLAFFLAFILIYMAFHRTRDDLNLNIKIDLWKSVRAGKLLMLLGLALIISSQYYFEALRLGAAEMIPKFKASGFSENITSKILSQINPNFKALEEDAITVDDFLLQAGKSQMDSQTDSDYMDLKIEAMIEEEYGKNVPAAAKEKIKNEALAKLGGGAAANQEFFLREGRKQLAEFVGHELSGKEKISEVFMEIINDKIDSFFQPDVAGPKNPSLIPLILAIILFLTVISIGSFVEIFGMLLLVAIFYLLVKLKLVSISKAMKEVEVLG